MSRFRKDRDLGEKRSHPARLLEGAPRTDVLWLTHFLLFVPKEYYIADASEDQVFVCVSHSDNHTDLYISEAEGLRFSLSLENVLYYSPAGAGSDTLVR